MLQKYKDKTKEIISYPLGKQFTIFNNRIIYGKNVLNKKIALGLCVINMNIHDCGDHTKVDQIFNITYDMTPNMYLLNCSKFCDTKRIFC